MLQLKRHDQISSDDQSKPCIICPNREIRFGEIEDSDRQEYSDDIFDDDASLDIYDAVISVFLFHHFLLQGIRMEPFEDVRKRFCEIDDESGCISPDLFRILEE